MLTADECDRLARWFLKVGLLSAHPDVIHDNPKLNGDPNLKIFECMEPEWLNWMLEGTAPPEGFSVYLTRRASKDEGPWLGERILFALPQISVDGIDLRYLSRSFGIRGLEVTIVWHPGWPIRHPLVEAGRAVQLWPNPTSFDVRRLPEVHSDEFHFLDGATDDIQVSSKRFHSMTLKPLSHDTDPTFDLVKNDFD